VLTNLGEGHVDQSSYYNDKAFFKNAYTSTLGTLGIVTKIGRIPNGKARLEKPDTSSLNKSSCSAPALGVTKLIIVTDVILVTLCCAT
jgi:hypothetical protein